MTINQPYLSVIKVAVPPSTKWQTGVVLEFSKQLIEVVVKFNFLDLLITASANQITWSLQVPRKGQQMVADAVYSHFPQAYIEIEPKQTTHIGYYLYHIQSGLPFFIPLRYVDAFKDIDPLVPIVKVMTNLKADETIVYELSLSPPRRNYKKLVDKFLAPTNPTMVEIFLRGILIRKGINPHPYREKSIEEKLQEREELEFQKRIREKVGPYLKEVVMSIKIRAGSSQRAYAIAQRFGPPLAVFDGEMNGLSKASNDTFPLILSPQEIAALWHLPTDQMKLPGIVWARSAVAPIPTELTQQTEGIVLGFNTFQGRSQPVRLDYLDRVTHVNMIGKTGVGKSTLLHRMIHQDIATGKGVAVIDPHGDLVDAILATSIPKSREQEVLLFDTRDQDYPMGLNLLTTLPGVSQEITASYALAVLRKMFAKQWPGDRTEMILDAALRALVAAPDSTNLWC